MPDMVKRINQIFADQVFHVPDYQRGYAWEEKQWNDLIEDLDLLSEGRNHFTGTLVLSPRGNGGSQLLDQNLQAYEAFDIIDGQQRLTTIVILLKAIHDQMSTLDGFSNLASRLEETYLHQVDQNKQPFTKLALNADSQDFFANNILELHPSISGPTIRSHQRLQAAKQHFTDYLDGNRAEKGEAFSEWLKTLYQKVILQLTLIVYPVENELDAGTIFETMNDRGKPLTEMEKVKNYLLYLSAKLELPAGHDLNRRINSAWKFIYEQLMTAGLAGRNNEDQLLRAHWLMVYDYDAERWDNARSIKGRFSLRRYIGKHAELLKDVISYLDTLQIAATAYCDIYNPSRQGAFNNISDLVIKNDVILWGKKLTRLGVRASYLPLLIAVRNKSRYDELAYLKTLQILEKYTFRVYYWGRARSNAGQTALFRLGYSYYQNANPDWMLEEVAQLVFIYCPDNTFEERIQRESENWYDWTGANYFLYEYEHHLAGGRPVQLTWETLNARPKASSVEHILPQTPEDPYWSERFTPEQRKRWTHDIANLTLTYDNSSLGNRRFPIKKGEAGKKGTYADSPLFIERDLASLEDWNVEALQSRRQKLLDWARDRWRVNAVPRPPQTAKTIEDMIDLADQYDLGGMLQAIHQAAGKLGMWPTIRKGIQYRHPHNYRLSTMVLYVQPGGFTIYFYKGNFANFPGWTLEEVSEIFEINDGWNWFGRERLPQVVEMLDRFYERMREKKGQ